MGQAGTPPDPIEARTGPIAVTRPVIVTGAEPAYEDALLLVQEAAAPIAVRTTKPWPLPLLTAESPFLLELHDLRLPIEGDGDLGPAQATGAQYRVIFQKLAVGPLPRLGIT